ncbi:hypothetical protein PRZ48_001463 [Zasmidium cellare]|uniref:Apple domain-containing protein n=1 Tax=Zasmidium cellare TaxID=395010 RepID=A0ABR0F3R8_ZASCE|nr:hypothetical protein PRZ48_001463 [Zasmidium cellare]
MIVPDLSRTLKPSREDIAPDPTPQPTATGTPKLVPVNASEIPRRRRRTDKISVFSRVFGTPERSTPFTTAANQGLVGRQSCASGLTYYSCANGFTGCCQGNPCTQTAQCSVEDPITSTGGSTTQSRTSTAQSSRTGTATANNSGTRTATSNTSTRTGTSTAGITTANGTPSGTATTTGGTTTLSSANATPAPTCPGAPSNYTDDLGIAYEVKCNIDNGGAYNQTIKVNDGGYAQCCSACSRSSDCVGFTFFGDNGNSTDAGNCYVRSSMHASEDFSAQSYVVALYKVDPSAVATSSPSPSSSAAADSNNSSGKSNTGAIAGGVVGGVAALGLLLFLAAFLIRRHRKKVDARHAAEKNAPTLPTSNPESDRYRDVVGGHHHRSGSTANDIYAPQGGSYHAPIHTHTRQRSIYRDDGRNWTMNKSADHFSELEGHSSTPPGLRAEGGRGTRIPAGVLRPPQMLDSKAVGGSRESVFLEHVSEMEDTSQGRPVTQITSPYSTKAGESPTLGHPSGSTTSLADETRRRQHLLYWNNYDQGQLSDQDARGQMSATMMPKTPPTARTAPQISPDNSGVGRDSSFVVSPLKVRKSDQGSDSSDSHIGPRRGTS